MSESINVHVQNVRSAILDLDSCLGEELGSISANEMCEILVGLSRLKDELAQVYSEVSRATADALGDQSDLLLNDGSRIEKRNASDRKGWQHKEIAALVAKKLVAMSVDMDTGERVMSPEEIAQRVLDYVQPSYWRVKQLSELGINADDYCEVGESKTNIIVRKVK